MTKQLGYPLGNWPVSFDPSVQMKPANRKLSVLELAAIWVYLEETQKRFLLNMSGEAQRRILRIFPKESEYVTAVIKRFKEIAFDEKFLIFEDVQELRQKLEGKPDRKQSHIAADVQRGLFNRYLLYPDGSDVLDVIRGSQPALIRRMLGLGEIDYTDADVEYSIKFLQDFYHDENNPMALLNITGAEINSLNSSRANRPFFPPEAGFIDPKTNKLISLMVPEIGIPVLRSDVYGRSVNGNGSWLQALEKIYGIDLTNAIKRTYSGFDVADIKKHYQELTERLRVDFDDPTYVATVQDIKDNCDESDINRIGYPAYITCFKRNKMNLDDLRIDCGYIVEKPVVSSHHGKYFNWGDRKNVAARRELVMKAYINMYARFYGLKIDVEDKAQVRLLVEHFEPPTMTQVGEINRNIGLYYADETDLVGQLVGKDVLIDKDVFEGQIQLIKAIENYSGGNVLIENNTRLASMRSIAEGCAVKGKPGEAAIPTKPVLAFNTLPSALQNYILENPRVEVKMHAIAVR